MNVGDYVRTNNGGIGKIINCPFKTMYLDEIWGDIEDTETIITNNVYKTSPNIIDLIENNDLIVDNYDNVYQVNYVFDNYVYTKTKEGDIVKTLVDYQIKSIVTKEQFESMKYKV